MLFNTSIWAKYNLFYNYVQFMLVTCHIALAAINYTKYASLFCILFCEKFMLFKVCCVACLATFVVSTAAD